YSMNVDGTHQTRLTFEAGNHDVLDWQPIPLDTNVWRLASDFKTAPDEANPNPDSNGQGVWAFKQGTTLHDPLSYRLLGEFIPNAFGMDGLEQWQGTSDPDPLNRQPAVGINATGSDQHPSTFAWPAGMIRV